MKRLLFFWFLLQLAACAPALGPGAVKTQPGDLLAEADRFYQTHRYDEALSRYEQYLKTTPQGESWQRAWLRAAEIYGIRGNWLKARQLYDKLLTAPVDRSVAVQARWGIGQAQYKLGNLSEAEQVLENLTASTLTPELRFKTNALLTEIALQRGDLSLAFNRLLLVAREPAAGDEEWYQDLKKRFLEQATAADLERLAALYPEVPLAPAILLQLAKQELQNGNPEKARGWITALQQRFPQSPEVAAALELLPPEPKPAAMPLVGCLLPLSGSHAQEGREVQRGLELAANQKGLRLVVVDAGDQPESVSKGIDQLAADPEIPLAVGFFPSAVADTAALTAQKAGLPLLALTPKKDITKIGPYIFRDFVTPQLLLTALIDQVQQRWDWRQFAILAPNNRYGQTMARFFIDLTTAAGGMIVAQAFYEEGARDLTKELEILVQATQGGLSPQAPAAVFVPDEAPGVAAVAQALAHTPLAAVPIVGTNLLSAPEALAQAGALEGVIFPEAFTVADPDPDVQGFISAYRQEYGEFPGYLAAQGYSSLQVAAAALASGPTSRAAAAEALARTKVDAGFCLSRGFTPQREAEIKFRLVRFEAGSYQILP